MKIDTLEEPRNPCAQAASACTARMFHWRANRTAPAGLSALCRPVAPPASTAPSVGLSSRSRSSSSTSATLWLLAREAAEVLERPRTTARPAPGDVQRTWPPRCPICAAKSVGIWPRKVTMWRPFCPAPPRFAVQAANRSEEHTSELQSLAYLVCRLLLEKKKKNHRHDPAPSTTNVPHTETRKTYDVPR